MTVDLGPPPAPALLRDPSVRVVYWLPARQEFVDAAGAPAAGPAAGRARTLVEQAGTLVAAVEHAASQSPDPAAVVAAGPALVNGRLRAELADVRASRARIQDAADAGRRHAERVLHDGAQQRLLAVALVLRMARGKGVSAGQEHLDEASAELSAALTELREVARDLYPVLLTDAGIGPALAALVERSPVPAVLHAVPDRRYADRVERACYFVVAEALAGLADSARTVGIAVQDRGDTMEIEVTGGPDVTGLEDRIAACGGRLSVDRSTAGARVRAVLPCG